MAKMKVADFLAMLQKAKSCKTLYVMGGWGFPLNDSNKDRTQSNSYNCQPERRKKIYAASSDTFSWDCCGTVKGVLWGWYGNPELRNGGAVYGSNGVPDYDAKELMFSGCSEQSKDFSKIEAGEFLWLDGHCGVYLGDGLAIESTPIWSDGVQITAVANIGKKEGYNSRTWTYHGHLKYVDYSEAPSPYKNKWVEVDGKWYYYDANGYMVKNDWKKYKGQWYYLGADGAMIAGTWKTIEGNDYYFYPDGHMAQDEWIEGWFLDMNGHKYECKGMWKEDKGGKYFETTAKWYPRSRSVMIDGKSYKFNNKGYVE